MEPRTVAAAQGLRWMRQGLEIFAAAPGTWLGITLVFLLIGVALGVVPFASLLWSVAVPIHVGGLMLGCDALRQGRPLELRYLFNGFEQPRVQPLALVGALYLAASIVVMLPAIALVIGTTFASAFAIGSRPTAGVGAVTLVVAALVFLLLVAAVFALSMAIWFAPALVVFRDLPALDAMKLSLRGALRNIGAFAVYGLVLMGIGLLVMLPFFAGLLLIAASAGDERLRPMLFVLIGGGALFALLCMLLLMPTMWGAMYASYRDVFAEPEPVASSRFARFPGLS